VGPWISAFFQLALSIAISAGWREPLLTLTLYGFLEVLTNNVGKVPEKVPIEVIMLLGSKAQAKFIFIEEHCLYGFSIYRVVRRDNKVMRKLP
jgi:hypothetical protein